MKIIVKMICLAVILLGSVGCSTDSIKNFDDHLSQDCARHYTGTLSAGMGTSGSVAFTIDCQPSGVPKPPASGAGSTPPAQPATQ